MNTQNKKTRQWLMIIVGWTVFGFFMAWQSYYASMRVGQPISFSWALYHEFVYAYLWIPLTPLILWLARKVPLDRKAKLWNILFHILMSLVVALLHKGLYHTLTFFLESTGGQTLTVEAVLSHIFSFVDYGVLLYWFLIALHYVQGYYERWKANEVLALRLETQLAQAQLQALRMQLHPHFLFNTLNAISVLVEKNPKAAREMIVKLSDLLRMTLEANSAQTVRLDQELALLEMYLQIEQIRFEDRLIVHLNISDETRGALVPYLILQPLVENAMRHGVAKQRIPTTVEILSSRKNGSLYLEVRDTGPGIQNPAGIKEGIGLSNTQARLSRLFNDRQSFEIRNGAGGGCIASMSIPFTTEFTQSNEPV